MKGIILAGGSGTRLYPSMFAVSKQILPVYDKPMIYYPLSVLMLAGITEIMIISTKRDLPLFKELFGDGSALGLSFSYRVQEKPKGIAEAFLIAEDFIDEEGVCLVLGDNVFYGQSFTKTLEDAMNAVISRENNTGAAIFGYLVSDPSAYGVLETDDDGNVISIEEKPEKPKSKYAVPGLYFYGSDVVTAAKSIVPSARGELEITDINRYYMEKRRLKAFLFGRGMAWLDTGSHETLLDASGFVAAVQHRQGLYVSCIEEIAYRKGYISREQLLSLSKPLLKTAYGEYLVRVANDEL